VYKGMVHLFCQLIGGRELAFGFNMRARSARAPAAWLRLRGRGRLCAIRFLVLIPVPFAEGEREMVGCPYRSDLFT